MEQGALIPCWRCTIVYPERYTNAAGGEVCPICRGAGTRLEPARMADESLSHEIMADTLAWLRAVETEVGPLVASDPAAARRLCAACVSALLKLQVYGSAWARREFGDSGPTKLVEMIADLRRKILGLEQSTK